MTHRNSMRHAIRKPEAACITDLMQIAHMSPDLRARITDRAVTLVKDIRASKNTGLMELFLEEYGLSTDEGIALMCLAEALLRVPDAETIDALIDDKITPSSWGKHLGASSSSLVNASTWALMITGAVLDDGRAGGISQTLRGAIKRLGEPVIRTAVARAMKELGQQFVLGATMEDAITRARKQEAQGYTYSYDMLGEAAMTDADAKRFHLSYSKAITALAESCGHEDIRDNPGVSVKLSALFPRYEVAQRDSVMDILVPRTRSLALLAKSVGMGLNIDAEEADRLDLSLDVIEAVLSDPSLADWDGFGVVVQAYGKRAPMVLDWLYDLAHRLDRKIMVRLVKGAYWDTEVKAAQVAGLDGFPVYTNKETTDLSYIACARKLLAMTDRIYPQFATHNARTVAAVLEMTNDTSAFEFQRLHGMGEALHDIVHRQNSTRCRIYAPVGPHKDLLAYLVRRLLENGANSSFVNQIVDVSVPPEEVAADPIGKLLGLGEVAENPRTVLPIEIFAPRVNSRGLDLTDPLVLAEIDAARGKYAASDWAVGPMVVADTAGGETFPVNSPFDPSITVARVQWATAADAQQAITDAQQWGVPVAERARVLRAAADLYEQNYGEIFALLAREAGKTLLDCDAELREAVDFLRYYADEAEKTPHAVAKGTVTCISPWNFPVAIFSGQIAAALACGNSVLAKPSEQTTVVAGVCVALLHEAGVPVSVLQLLPGPGASVGAELTSSAGVNGVCFTGSTATARRIYQTMATALPVDAGLIAETGGLNAMIVDSTALPEQVVRDILASAFQSAGQRCSALRCLYVQEDIADDLEKMLFGAMDALRMGNPWDLSTDVGPVIDQAAHAKITAHIAAAHEQGRVLKTYDTPNSGWFVPPTAIRVDGIADMKEEIFGPVLHIARYKASELESVIDDINATGYGLTFGLHTRIDERVQQVVDRVQAGNIYVNRNQIGAIVGCQPFGGHGLSGTGPKAGGPMYLERFRAGVQTEIILGSRYLPGPTGESNQLTVSGGGTVLCLGPTDADRAAQEHAVRACGSQPVALSALPSDDRLRTNPPKAVLFWGDTDTAKALRVRLAALDGPIIPLVMDTHPHSWLVSEHHICVDTTAAGGNATLLA
jgi:RHH-type proline utilization regulon transcriptional repressor/proline dehydrogenase/delta 1-pyrroline-5-carboxylate dehydrogenase